MYIVRRLYTFLTLVLFVSIGLTLLQVTPPEVRAAGFSTDEYHTSYPLTIDPALDYSTFLGGSSYDKATDIAVDNTGNIYVVGYTSSSDFPTAQASQPGTGAQEDGFIAKINPAGDTLLYSTYLGGYENDRILGMTIDDQGNVYVTGVTESDDFPVKHAYQSTNNGGGGYLGGDAFIAKLDANGTVQYSTYLGGDSNDAGNAIAVDSMGNVYVAGRTSSRDFPLMRPMQADYAGSGAYPWGDVFVSKLNAQGDALVFSTYVGGEDLDEAFDIELGDDDSIYIVGSTESQDFPLANPQQSIHRGDHEIFVSKLNSAGSALVYSTYLGGSGEDIGYGIAVDRTGSAYITGSTWSYNFPIADPFQAAFGGAYGALDYGDAFITKYSSDGSSLVYSTYLGGKGNDVGRDIAINSAGEAYITGATLSTDFPLSNAIQNSYGGRAGSVGDMFVSKLSSAGISLIYSTYLGEQNDEVGNGIALYNDNAYIAGTTDSGDFPVNNAFQSMQAGLDDALIVKIADDSVEEPPPSYSFIGRVTDNEGEPLVGVRISYGSDQVVTTAEDGRYLVMGLSNGSYILTPSHRGYRFDPPTQTIKFPPNGLNEYTFTGIMTSTPDDSSIYLPMITR